MTGFLGEDKIEGGNGDDNLQGTGGADIIEGNDGRDTIIGGIGADRLYGGNGNDEISGGEGADRIRGGNGADELSGGNGADRFEFSLNDSSENNMDFIIDFEVHDKIDLSDLGVTGMGQISAFFFNNSVTVVSVNGTDFQFALNGNQELSNNNFIFFGRDDISSDDPDQWDGDFEASISGGLGQDSLVGDIYDDSILGGGSFVSPEDQGDIIYGGAGHDRIYGNGGSDEIYGDEDVNGLFGYNDSLYGGLGNDSLFGGGGDDEIYGHDGADLLSGGRGTDTLGGGTGNDIFLIMQNTGSNELILDFDQSGNDVISFQRSEQIQSFSDIAARMVSDDSGSYINLGNGNGLLLAGVLAGELSAGDFFFWG